MREIKFRVWIPFAFSDNAPKHGEYISLDLAWRENFIEFEPDGNTIRQTGNDNGYNIEQFTGCYDAEGKEIYEGDIVSNSFQVGTIEFDDEGKFGINFTELACQDVLRQLNKDYIKRAKIIVIGNIHDNPELLPAHDTP